MGRRRSGSGTGFRAILLFLMLVTLSQAAWMVAVDSAFAQSAEEIARRNIASFKSTFDPEMVKAAGLTQSQAEQMRKIYAFQISNDYTARRLLKTAEFEGLGREYYKMWFQDGDGLIRQVIGRAKGKMSGYSPEVLYLIEVIQNETSRTAMKAPMDFDVGILTRTKEQAREVLEKIGGPGGVAKFHRDLQKALEEAYLEVFASLGGTPGSINAARSFISATTGWHPEAYADVKVLKKGGVASKDLVQQTVDVSKYKVSEMRKHAEHGALTLDEAMEEAARGTAKDLDKVERVFNHIEKITGVKPQWSAEQLQMIEVMKKVEKREMSAAAANAEIGRISGGRLDLFSACDNLMDQMESAWKLRPKKPQELLLSIFAEFLDDADYEKSFKALLEGNSENLPASAKKVIGELEVVGKARLLSIRGGSASEFMGDFAKDFPAYKICAKPGDQSVQELIKLIESGSKGEDVAVIFGKEQTERLRKIQELMKPEIKAKIQVRFSTNKFALWELDQKGRVLLGDPGAATLGIDAGVGLAMAFWQTSTIMDQNLSPEEESRQILNAWGTSLPVVGDIAQGMIEGIEAYYGEDKTKYFKAGAWLAIGAAGLVPGAQVPAMVLGLTLATYEVSSSYFDIKKDKEILEAWLASGEFDKETGKLQKLYDNKGGAHELSFEGIITDGGIPYKEVITETTIRESVYLYTERNGLDQNEKLQSYIRALKKLYPDFPFKETLREPLTIGKPLFAATIREGGAKEPFKTVAMLMFVKAKQIADAEANRACQGIMAQVEAEYQARHRTGDADRIFDELKALGGRLGLPLYENVNNIFDSFSNFIIQGLKTPWVRESIPRRRVLLAEKYLSGYLEIEKSLKTIRGVFERAGVNPPGFNLSGYLEVDAPRIKDLEAAYVNRAIGETARDVQAMHRELSGDNAYVFNSNRPDPCDAELFKQLANIRVRIVEAEDRKLLLEQWTGKKSAAERSRDASLRKAQDATQGMKTGSVVTIPSAVWDSLCENYEAAYAWGNVRLEGSQVYEEAIVGQTERIEKLTREYTDAKEKGKEPMGTCLAQALQGSIQMSNAAPTEGDPASARIVLTKGQTPKGAQWTWQATGGIEIGNTTGEQATLTARSSGTVTAMLVMAGKTLATIQKTVTVKPKDKKDKNTDGKTDDKTGDKKDTTVAAPTCSYEYSDWGECIRATKKQTRTVKATKPEGCVEKGKPALEQGCTPPPSEEDKKNAYLNCLCRCSSGWAGHIGVWYDPEGKSEPECKSSGPCFGGAGAFGCTRRHFFVGPNDCGKGCWESAFGKDTYDPKKADELRKNENKKYKKPLTAKITPSKNPADFGDIITLQAEASEGSGGYSYQWGGCAQDAKDYQAKVANTRDCKPCAASVTVTDQDGDSASATVTIQCNTVKVKLTKENPKENTVPVGGKASFYAEVFSGDKPFSGPTLFYVWERNPDAIFGDPKNPRYETSGGSQMRNTATFRKAGTTPVWVTVLREIDGKKTTIGESEQIPITVANPELSIKVAPEKPNIGQEVKLQVESKPAVGDDIIGFWWEIPGYWTGTGDKASFKPKDDKPVKITVHAKTKDGGDEVGTKDVTITAQAYQVSISEPRYLESPPQVWKCDTQLGQAQHCGMVTLKPNEFAVSRDIFLKATLAPQPESPRYKWTVDPSGSCGQPGAGSEIKLNCSNTVTYTVKVEVTNADGAKLGEASQSVSISVSQSDLNNSKNVKDAYDKLQRAKGLVAEGKLDEGIALANEAAGLDPKNAEAKTLSQKWSGEKQTVNQQLEKAKKLITENHFNQAEKEFAVSQKLHPKYPPVVETEKLLRAKKDGYKKDVADKLNRARELAKQGKLDEAIALAEEASKLDKAGANPVLNELAALSKKQGWDHVYNRNFKDAVKRLGDAARLNPNDQDAISKLAQAKKFAAVWPQVEQKAKEFDQLISEKKVFSAQKKMLEIQELQREMTGGMANPLSKKVTDDFNKALQGYNEFRKGVEQKYTESFKEKNWEEGQKLIQESLKRELSPADEKTDRSRLAQCQQMLGEQKQVWDFYQKSKADFDQSKVNESSRTAQELRQKASVYGDRAQQRQQMVSLANALEKKSGEDQKRMTLAKQLRGEGEGLQKQNKLQEAIGKYRESLALVPDAALAEHVRLLEEKQAETVQKKATADKLWQEGTDLFNQGRPSDALAKFKESRGYWSDAARTKYVSDLEARQAKAAALRDAGAKLQQGNRIPEAIAKYKESQTYWPDPGLTSHIATLEGKIKQDADTAARKAKAKQLRDEGYALQQKNQLQAAVGEYKESLAILPDKQLEDYIRQLEAKIAAASVPTSSTSTAASPVASSGFYLLDLQPYGGKKGSARKVKNIDVDDGSWIRLKATDEKKLTLDIPLPQQVLANSVAVVTNLDNAHFVKDGVTTTVLTVHTTSGDRVFEFKAGVHTSEWNRSETGGADHAFPKDTYIGDKRWMAVFTLPAGSVVTGLRFDHRDPDKKFYHMGAAPGFCLRGITLAGAAVSAGTGTGSTPSSTAKGNVIFTNGNIGGVYNNPSRATTFTLREPHVITLIMDYHWNNGRGATPGTIALRGSDGRTYGPWQAKGNAGQGGAPNAYWNTYPNVTLPAGSYTVVDSDPASWAQNSGSQGCGHTRIEGYPVSGATASAPVAAGSPSATATSISAELTNNSRENTHIFADGETFGPGNRLAPGEKRRVAVTMKPDGSVTFKAGRNGQVMATKTWRGIPGDSSRVPVVVFDESNPYEKLIVTTGLR